MGFEAATESLPELGPFQTESTKGTIQVPGTERQKTCSHIVLLLWPSEPVELLPDAEKSRQMVVSNCSSIQRTFPAKIKMPIDMALPLYLSNEHFVYRAPKTYKPALGSSVRFQHPRHVDHSGADGESSRNGSKKGTKQVTFADHRGLPLTKVKVFSAFTDPIDIPLNIQEIFSSVLTLNTEEDKLLLDFPQPSSDYLRFRQSLESNLVCLEHCVLKEKALAGTIKVKNVSFEKSVKLRVTFDTWKSHTDIDCVYIKDTYPNTHSDTFSFHVSLPDEVKADERVEFAISYEVDGNEYWDSNHGNNYRIVWSSMKKSQQVTCSRRTETIDIHFDRYGSPTCSHGLFPDWPSYAGYENIGPYY